MIPIDYFRIVDYQRREIKYLRDVIRLWTDMPSAARQLLRDADIARNEVEKIEKGAFGDQKNGKK